MFALFAEVERDLISERTREGLAKARASGRRLGRPKGALGVSRLDGREEEIRHFLELGVSKSSIARITGVTRTTLYNFIATRGLKARPLACIPAQIWLVPLLPSQPRLRFIPACAGNSPAGPVIAFRNAVHPRVQIFGLHGPGLAVLEQYANLQHRPSSRQTGFRDSGMRAGAVVGGFVPALRSPRRRKGRSRRSCCQGIVTDSRTLALWLDRDCPGGRLACDRKRPGCGRDGRCRGCSGMVLERTMIPVPSGARVWLATGVTDMRARDEHCWRFRFSRALGRDPRHV